MLQIALAFFLGDLWVQTLPELAWSRVRWPVLAVLLLAAVAHRLTPTARRRIWTCALAFALGLGWAFGHGAWRLSLDLDAALEGQDLTIIGHLASLPQASGQALRFVFAVESAEVTLPPQIELTWYSPPNQLAAAQRWQLQVRLRKRHGMANPGGRDREQQLLREGIGATGYVRESALNQRFGDVKGEWVLKTRAAITARLAAALADAPMQGVIRGLVVGDQQAIDDEAWRVFVQTGTSHLMAISGSHIGMVGALFAWAGGFVLWWPNLQRWKVNRAMARALPGLGATVVYSLLAGMSLPTLRTLLMMTVYFGAQLWWRHSSVWSNFGLALLLVLCVDPMAPLALGAWLSFGAVAVILLGMTGRVGTAPWWHGWLRVQGVVTVGLIPILLLGFGAMPLWSPLVNLLAIPLFTVLLVPAVLLGTALLFIAPQTGTVWLHWIARLLDLVYRALEWVAAQPQAMWYVPRPPTEWWVLLLMGVLLMVLPLRWPWRLSGLFCALPALLYVPPPLPEGAVRMVVLDVGQGLAVAVHTRHHVLLYDAGPRFPSGRDTGELVVVPYLRHAGVRGLSRMMISHGDQDHAGGMQSVLAQMPVDRLLLGPSVHVDNILVANTLPGAVRCERGQRWQWDGVSFEVLHPDEGGHYSDNDSSCALSIRSNGGSVLLLGDLEQRVERQLVEGNLVPRSDIVVAAHHGSRSSSSPPLVKAAQASWVVFSAGYRNRWGFPKEEVVQRWQESGARSLNTAETGAVSFLMSSAGITASTWRSDFRHYWNP